MSNSTLSVKPKDNYILSYDGSYSITATTHETNSDGLIRMVSGRASDNTDNFIIKAESGDLLTEATSGSYNITSGKETSNSSIYLNASATTGGIKLNSGSYGITQYSTGNIDIHSKDSNINIGVFPQDDSSDQTNSIIMESANEITMNTGDFQLVASDTLNLISLTGDIRIGSSVDSSVIRFENDNLLVNQTSSTLDKQLDVRVTSESTSQPGYNGIIVNSTNTEVASDLTLQTSDSNASISMGVQPQSSKYSYLQEYVAYQSGTSIIVVKGPEFTSADIGRTVYLSGQDTTDTIASLGKTILSADSTYATYSLTSGGTYTGSTSKVYRIQIDSIHNTADTFRWSNDGGKTYQTTFKTVTTGSAITLEEGVTITFSQTTGHKLYDYWTFHAKITATVGTTRSLANTEKIYTLQPFNAYIKTSNISDIQIQTATNERARITADGSIGIGTHLPTSTLQVYNEVGTANLVNEYQTNYQINPSVASLNNGGYVVVWEDSSQDGSTYGVYGQQYMADGKKFANQFRVNQTTSGHQTHPHVAGRNTTNSKDFIVVWASEESANSGVYDIYCQIYINGSAKKAFDIQVNSVNSNNKQLYPRAVGLTGGNYLVVWNSDDSNSGDFNVYGRYVDNGGNLVGSRFQVNSTTDDYSVMYPYPFSISDNDSTIPGGYGVVFMNEYESQNAAGGAVNDDDRYNIQYRLFNSSGTATISDTDITTSSSDYITISDGLVSAVGLEDGGFAISFYRNYPGKASLYGANDTITGNTSGITSGRVASVSGNILTITLTAGDEYLVGETITIENNWVEKIDKTSFDGAGNGTLTLSTSHKAIDIYKFTTSSVTPVFNKQVNTSELVADRDMYNLSGVGQIRNNTIFNYERPRAEVTELGDKSLVVGWTSGSISRAYYQQISTSDGSKVGSEKNVSSEYNTLKQRNIAIAGIKTLEGQDAGVALVWDMETLDTSAAGVYQTIANPNNPILRVHNKNTEFAVSQEGMVGIGTKSPADALHITSSETTSNIIVQNSNTNYKTSGGVQNIKFTDGNNKVLGTIKSGYTHNYQKMNPKYDNLVAYYTMDEVNGSNYISDGTANNMRGKIENFDVFSCWKDGKINKSLEFNGVNNYVNVGSQSTLYNLGMDSGSGGSGYTLSSWIKISENINTTSNADIIFSGSDVNAEGAYSLMVERFSSNSKALLRTSLTTDTQINYSNATTELNDNNWHLVNAVYNISNSTLQTYIDGTLKSNAAVVGNITSISSSDILIGSRDKSNYFFEGEMDEMRFYNTPLSSSEISKIHKYGNETLGKMTFTTQGGLDNIVDTAHGFTLDDTGRIQGLQAKPHPFTKLSGVFNTNSSNTAIIGTAGSKFDSEIQVGDTLKFTGSSNKFVVSSISGENNLNIHKVYAETASQNVVRKPAILSYFDIDDNLKGVMNYQGNMILGGYNPTSKLELYGTGDTGDLPYLTLTNSSDENTDGGRESRVTFQGTTSGTQHSLGYIEMSHDGTSSDTKGKMRIFVNNGTTTTERLIINNQGNVAIGSSSPLGLLHLSRSDASCDILATGGNGSDATNVYGEKSNMYFSGTQSITNVSGTLDYKSLAKIQGSSDSTENNIDGRLDFFTNNDDNSATIGLESRMSITSTGKVGIGIDNPTNTFHVGPKYNLGSNFVGSQSDSTTVNLTSGTVNNNDLINGKIVFNDGSRFYTRTISGITDQNTLTVDSSSTVSSNNLSIYYPGLNVDSTGNVSVGITSCNSKFHVEGPISTAIKTVTSSSYTLTNRDSTILADATSNTITINIPTGVKGRKYFIKKIDDSNPVNIVPQNGTIDGESSISLTAKNSFIEIQFDGSNYFIVSDEGVGITVTSTLAITGTWSTSVGSPTSISLSYETIILNSDGKSADTYYLSIGAGAGGQRLYIIYDDMGSSETIYVKVDFGENNLGTVSGLSRYLVFYKRYQSCNLVYIAGTGYNKWIIVNSGASIE